MAPRSIAVVGASQREVRANRVIRTLQTLGYEGQIFPVNPRYTEVLGLRCYPDLGSTPSPADCAVVAIPAAGVPALLTAAARSGVRSAVVLASGFAESGEHGRRMQAELEQLADTNQLLICGPNCFGILNIRDRAASFIGSLPSPLLAGSVALISQSGGLTNIIVPPLMDGRGIGFSYVVSCGNQAGVTIEEYIKYFVDDDATDVIAVFVEGFKRPRELLAVAERAASLRKPIVMLKIGRSEVAKQSALAHTGSLVGAADVAQAIFRKAGIVQVETLNEFMETIALLSRRAVRERFSPGTGLGVLTGTGGLIGYVGDAAGSLQVNLPPFAAATRARLGEVLPDFAGAANPLDGTGAMYDDPSLFGRLLTPLAEDPAVDVVAVNIDFNRRSLGASDAARNVFVPTIVELAPRLSKPVVVFTARSGNAIDPDVATRLGQAGVPLLDGTESALVAIRNLAQYRAFLDAPVETRPTTPLLPLPVDLHDRGGGVLDSVTAFRLLEHAGIPVPALELVHSEGDAASAAARIGFPVAMKIESPSIQHKTEVGGVVLGVTTPVAARAAFSRILAEAAARTPVEQGGGVIVQQMGTPGLEMLLGVKHDPSFGPVVVCGLGGIYVEVLDDIVLAVPPFSPADAHDLLVRLRGWPLLDGVRGRPRADTDALARAMAALGDLAVALADGVEAIDVNPLLVYPAGGGVLAVDVLVELR
jgi:acetyltransferase